MLDDYELLYLANEKNEDAINELLKKYYWLISYKAIKCATSKQDEEDFVNEGIIGFYEAINSYKEINNTRFITYLNSCLDRRLSNYKKFLLRKKFYILNNALSLDDNNLQLDKYLLDNRENPDIVLINEEKYKILKKKILKCLNSTEELVFILKEQNFTPKEISRIIDIKIVDIYNIIKSIRTKTIKVMSN